MVKHALIVSEMSGNKPLSADRKWMSCRDLKATVEIGFDRPSNFEKELLEADLKRSKTKNLNQILPPTADNE